MFRALLGASVSGLRFKGFRVRSEFQFLGVAVEGSVSRGPKRRVSGRRFCGPAWQNLVPSAHDEDENDDADGGRA